MRRPAALILLAVLGLLAGQAALAQAPDAARANPSLRSLVPGGLPGAARPGANPGAGGSGTDGPSSSFSAFPDAAPRDALPRPGAPAPPGNVAAPGSLLPPTTTAPSRTPGLSGSPATPAAPAVPLIGAGNFCAQPAGACGPACSVTCPQGRMAYCTGGQGGPTSPTGSASCATPPRCSCR